MAQHDYVIANGTGAAVRSDLNNALAAIVSQNSGATEPATTYAFQFWADTTTNLLKLRNSANNAWVTLFQLDGEWSTLPVENGTAAAPSIYFKDSGTDTGFYSPGTDQVAISTGGTGRLFINSSGSVGIGTSSPSYILEVRQDSSGVPVGINMVDTNASGRSYSIRSDAGQLRFRDVTGSADRVTLDSSGRLGIGTTTAESLLTLKAADTNALFIKTADSNYSSLALGINSSINAAYIQSNKSGSGTERSLAFYGALSEWARFDTSGRFLVGTSSSPSVGDSQYSYLVVQGYPGGATGNANISLQRGETAANITSGEQIGDINFTDSAGYSFAKISCLADANAGTNDYPGRLVFSTTADGASSPTERMRITNKGQIYQYTNINNWALQTQNQGNSSANYGISIWCGTDAATGTNYAVEIADGDGGAQGYITFTGGTVTYGAFTAYHPCILPEADKDAGYPYGTLLETTSIEYTQKDGHDTERGILYNVRKTQAANSRAVLGAYGSSMNGGPSGETNRHQALVLGDGHILCNSSGGNIKVGDGICSSATPGIGQKATATPSMIIGIAQEDVTFADDDEVKLVAVQYGVRQFIPWGD